MVLVRMVFQAKWDKAQQVVNELKQYGEFTRRMLGPGTRQRILTDLSGPFNTVVVEIDVENLAAWEKLRSAMFTNPEFQQAQATMETPYESGRTEFYTIEST